MGSGYAKKRKEARLMEQHFQTMEENLSNKRYRGTAGNELVELILNGKGHLISLNIKPDCLDPEDPECLQDLIIEAHCNAMKILEDDRKMNSNLLPFS